MTDFLDELDKQKEWSRQTFGPYFRPKGIVDHLRKECNEILEDPFALEEWIDVLILGFDGAMRSGRSPQEILEAYVAKQVINRARVWPDWTQHDPDIAIEHIKVGEEVVAVEPPEEAVVEPVEDCP